MAKKPPASTPEKPREKPRGRTRAIADLVGDVGGVAFRRFGFTQAALIERWPEIVGETYARHCRPLRLRFARGAKEQGTLAIAATGALAPMLRHVEPQIIDRANRILGYAAVARIAIEQGAQAATPPPPPPPKPGPLPESARSTLKQIDDPELRATLQSLAEALATSHGPPKIR
jgi:hypothetical protein